MEKKIGCYICTGCEIGEAINAEAALEELSAPVKKTHEALCSPEGLAMLKQDMESEGVNALCIGACSMREKTEVFNTFDPKKVIVERVNLREHVAWCQKPGDEDTQMMVNDYMIMGLTKVEKSDFLEAYSPSEEQPIDKTIIVVGGGVTGLTAALEAAKAGYSVVIVEKEAELGGFLGKMNKQFPKRPPYAELQDTNIGDLIAEAEANSNIKIYKNAIFNKVENGPCIYEISLNVNGKEVNIRGGAFIMATGWKPYDPNNLGHLGYGNCSNVITNVMMEEMAAKGKLERPSDGQEPKSVLFIQCAGSRDPEHLPYCSAVCCRVSLKQAKYVREMIGDSKVYILYKDIRSPGLYEDFYKNMQQDEGLFLTKGEVASVTEDADGSVVVEAEDTLVGKNIKLKADMVVLATGMVPNSADGEAIRKLTDAKATLKKEDAAKPQIEAAEQDLITYKDHEGSQILNLNYRQGPDLPMLKYGMPDSHFICFPYETRRTGIYAAGPMRTPMDIQDSMDDAAGAAMKAIQCVELTSQGKAVHPRAGDESYPSFFLQRCTQCKRCTEECPFGTINEDAKGTPEIFPTRCRRCGICMGACPERIISFKNYSVDMIASEIKSLEIPDEDEEKPRVLVFMCENDAYPALDIVGKMRLQYSPFVRVIPLRCLGSTNIVWIADSLSSGFDGILLIGCKYGDDYQCHYVKGSELCNTRLGNVKETLDRLALESERIRFEQLEFSEYEKIPKIIEEFMETIDRVGPNPYKDF